MNRDRSLTTIVRASLVRWFLVPSGTLLLLVLVLGLWRTREATFQWQIRNATWIRTYLTTFLDRAEHMLDFVVVDATGEIDYRSIPVLSSGVRAEDPVFRRVMILDSEANLVSSYPAASGVIDVSGIIGKMSIGEGLAITAPYFSTATNRMVVAAIRRGTIAGYTVAAELNLNTLQHSITSEFGRFEDATAFLTDRWGNVIAHPDMRYVREQVHLGALEPIRDVGSHEPITGLYRVDDTLRFVTAVRELRSGWTVVVMQDALVALTPTLSVAIPTFAFLATLWVMALGLFRRRLDAIVVRPLTRFAGEIETLKRRSGLTGNPPAGTFRELETLFHSFQEMSETILRREGELKTAVEENETLLREIHHRVKNNLNVVASLLSLQSTAIDSVEAARAAFQESRNRIFSIARVHESLYGGENLSAVDMGGYIRQMMSDLTDTYGQRRDIGVRVEAEHIHVDIQYAVPCGIILNELVTNAYKHAFPQERPGEITVEFTKPEEDRYRLVVRDNGVGIDESAGDVADLYRHNSLGMKLIGVLVGQISGTMTYRVDNGSCFAIEWSDSEEAVAVGAD